VRKPNEIGRPAAPKTEMVKRGCGVGKRPLLCTVDEVAAWLRTTRKAVYSMHERGQLPAPVRVGRRLLFDEGELVRWIEMKRKVERNAK